MSKLLTDDDLRKAAEELGVEFAAVKAVAMVESRGNGFQPNGEPTILFERHIFWQRLKKAGIDPTPYPRDICNPSPGGYGTVSAQHGRLQKAAEINRTIALESASWGKFQVMGFNYHMSFPTLQEFINGAYESEAQHLKMFLGYVKACNLVKALKNKDWLTFAIGYNGKGQKGYDKRMAEEYRKAS